MSKVSQFYKALWPVDTGYPLIRIGGNDDGSYLLPDVLQGVTLCLSPGVCGNYSFEKHLLDTYGIISLLCDPEDEPPADLHQYLTFDRFALSSRDATGQSTLRSWLHKYGYECRYPRILSMDIEGAEVEVLLSLSDEELLSFRIITVELHYLHLLNQVTNSYGQALHTCVNRLMRYFDVVHFKPNNNCPYILDTSLGARTMYTCVEVTLLNKICRRYQPRLVEQDKLPNFLDRSNVNCKDPVDMTAYREIVFGNLLY